MPFKSSTQKANKEKREKTGQASSVERPFEISMASSTSRRNKEALPVPHRRAHAGVKKGKEGIRETSKQKQGFFYVAKKKN